MEETQQRPARVSSTIEALVHANSGGRGGADIARAEPRTGTAGDQPGDQAARSLLAQLAATLLLSWLPADLPHRAARVASSTLRRDSRAQSRGVRA